MFKRIDHIELLTPAPERTIAFYVSVLGFTERERARIDATPSGPLDLVYLELGGTTVEVMCYPEAGSIPPRSTEQRLGWQCLALEVDDIDSALRVLDEKGVRAAWGPVKRQDYARAEIRDPDGNPIELRQWYRRAAVSSRGWARPDAAFPPVHEFRQEQNSRRWVAPSGRGDHDLAVPGDGGGPRESAFELLDEADQRVPELFSQARHYTASFCQAPEYGLANEPTLIELEVTECRGQPVVSIAFNFDSDVYGLWAVAFSRAAPGTWIPVSFRRENW